jgi:chromosome condensin MukBEF complex kleisin-like MukF subunit
MSWSEAHQQLARALRRLAECKVACDMSRDLNQMSEHLEAIGEMLDQLQLLLSEDGTLDDAARDEAIDGVTQELKTRLERATAWAQTWPLPS